MRRRFSVAAIALSHGPASWWQLVAAAVGPLLPRQRWSFVSWRRPRTFRRSTSALTGLGGGKDRTDHCADPSARTGQHHSDGVGHAVPIPDRAADQGSAAGTYCHYPPIAHDMLLAMRRH